MHALVEPPRETTKRLPRLLGSRSRHEGRIVGSVYVVDDGECDLTD